MWLKDKASLVVLFLFLLAPNTHAAKYSITIENLTEGLYFKNLIIAAHNEDVDLFEPASSGSKRLQWLAECGEPKYYFELSEDGTSSISDSPDPEEMVFNDFGENDEDTEDIEFWNVAALDPRMEVELQLVGPKQIAAPADLDAVRDDNVLLSVFGRVMATNDGFVGLDARALPTSAGEEKTYDLYIWDAGSETNNEILVAPEQCEVDCSAEEAALWDCTDVGDCREEYLGLAECNNDECSIVSSNVIYQECYETICSEQMTKYSECYVREKDACTAAAALPEDDEQYEELSDCEDDIEETCETESDITDCYDSNRSCISETDSYTSCYVREYHACELDQEKDPENRQYSSIADCMVGKCDTDKTEVNSCVGDNIESTDDDKRCGGEAIAYTDCYAENYAACIDDQSKEESEQQYDNMTDCIETKCEDSATPFNMCRSSVEACESAQINLSCSAENCMEHYSNVADCMDWNLLNESVACSREEDAVGCCADENLTYWECLAADLECQGDREDNACDLENIFIPDLPGLTHHPLNRASGVESDGENPARVHIHRGVMGDDDLDGGISDLDSSLHRWDGPVARIVIIRK